MGKNFVKTLFRAGKRLGAGGKKRRKGATGTQLMLRAYGGAARGIYHRIKPKRRIIYY